MNNNYFENSNEESNKKVDELLENIRSTLSEAYAKTEWGNSVLDPAKAKNVLDVFNLMKLLTKGTGAEVTYELNEPFVSTGSVSVVCKDFNIKGSRWIETILDTGANVNIFPRSDGYVQMDFTFRGLTKNI